MEKTRGKRPLKQQHDEAWDDSQLEIEALQQGQQDLEEALHRYVELYEDAPIGYATLTAHGTIAKINLTGAMMLGKDRQRLQGTILRRYLADRDEFPRLMGHFRRCRVESGRVETLVALKTADGQRLDVNLISHSGAAASCFHTAMVDLTEKLRSERSLSDHARRFALLADIATQLLVGPSPRFLLGRICSAVSREIGAEIALNYFVVPGGAGLMLENCHGLSANQKPALRQIAIGDGPCGLAAERREPVILTDFQQQDEERCPALRDLGIHALVCYPLVARDRLLGTLAFATRTREAFSAEECQFLRTISGLVTASMDRDLLMVETEAARETAEQASRAKDDFLANLSHELRTPLNPVLLMASDGAADAALPEEGRQMFESIRKNVELEARLIDDLLDITRVTRGKVYLRMEPCQLTGILQDALATVAGDIAQKQLRVKTRFADPEATVLGDAVRLQQVFWNLLRNAVKFTPAGGKLQITEVVTKRPRGAEPLVSVKITDSGLGMSRDELNHVFRPFAQGRDAAHAAHHASGGLGLGLAISKGLVELHSGMIYARSRGRGQGSTFIVELPLPREADLFLTPAPVPVSPAAPFVTTRGRTQVLLVEDHEGTRAVLARLLTRRHYQVASAGCVAEAMAIAAAREHPFDVLISDIGLPDGSGFDIMAALRRRHPVPGIALTGYGTDADVQRSRDAGFLAHLTKPISIHALERALTQVLEPGWT